MSNFSDRHPSVAHVANLLHVNPNLPDDLKIISEKFAVLRDDLLRDIQTDTPEVAAGLRKILEAKDCFVRAAMLVGRQAQEAITDFKTAGNPGEPGSGKGV